MAPRVIAICGFKRTGKDTIADWFCAHHGYEKLKIADPLKRICNVLFNLTEQQLEGNEKELTDPRWGVSPRRIMQFVGTEMMQYKLQELMPQVDRTFWIKHLIDRCSATKQEKVVISDVRFVHEYNALKSHYGREAVFIKVISDRNNQSDNHESEKEWLQIPCDYAITNNTTTTISDLHSTLMTTFPITPN